MTPPPLRIDANRPSEKSTAVIFNYIIRGVEFVNVVETHEMMPVHKHVRWERPGENESVINVELSERLMALIYFSGIID